MLKVIDVSSYQSLAVVQNQLKNVDGVIVKATEGTGYVNPLCDQQYQLAKKAGKLLGVYHYANGNDPIKEADYFIKNIMGYVKAAILCLDWESGSNKSWGDKTWCSKFIDRIHSQTGVYPLIYVSASAVNQVANLVNKCGLWVAGYPTNVNSWTLPSFLYKIAPWNNYTIWQFSSSGGLDKNYANLTRESWLKLADPKATKISKPNVVNTPTSNVLYPNAPTAIGKFAYLQADGKRVSWLYVYKNDKITNFEKLGGSAFSKIVVGSDRGFDTSGKWNATGVKKGMIMYGRFYK